VIGHQCYKVTCNAGSWHDALAACQSEGARLGRITDSVVNDWVAQTPFFRRDQTSVQNLTH